MFSYGQTYTGTINLFSQAQVDSFGALGYTRIDGSIRIGDPFVFQPNDITSLSPLLGLETVDTGLFIANNSLASLNGLDSLKSVYVIDIMSNFNLSSLSALSQIDTVHNLWVSFNGALEDLNGLNNLKVIENHCDIYVNNALTSLEGLNNLNSVGGFMRIAQNSNLASIQGLSSLNSIALDFNIAQNEELYSLNGLENLLTVGGIDINNNTILEDYCALNNLISNSGITSTYEVNNNAFNPTITMMQTGLCNSTLSTDDIEDIHAVTLSPNPTTGEFTLNLEHVKATQIQVINQLGQEIYSTNQISTPNLQLSIDAPKGVYTVVIHSENNTQSLKVVKG